MELIQLRSITGVMLNDLVKIWRRSVEETHGFLSQDEINEIETYVPDAIAEIETLVVAVDKNELVGFMGIESQKLEMLFLDPKSRGKGLGKKFIKMALDKFDVKLLDVNEDNPKAVGFYEYMGFEVTERSDLDDQGKPYPILHMKYVE